MYLLKVQFISSFWQDTQFDGVDTSSVRSSPSPRVAPVIRSGKMNLKSQILLLEILTEPEFWSSLYTFWKYHKIIGLKFAKYNKC